MEDIFIPVVYILENHLVHLSQRMYVDAQGIFLTNPRPRALHRRYVGKIEYDCKSLESGKDATARLEI